MIHKSYIWFVILVLGLNLQSCKKEEKVEIKKNETFPFKNLTKEENESLQKFHEDFDKHLKRYGFIFPLPESIYPGEKQLKNFLDKYYYKGTYFFNPEDSTVVVYLGGLDSVLEYNQKDGYIFNVYYNIIGAYDFATKNYKPLTEKDSITFKIKIIEGEWKLAYIPFTDGVMSIKRFLSRIEEDNPKLYTELSKKYNIRL